MQTNKPAQPNSPKSTEQPSNTAFSNNLTGKNPNNYQKIQRERYIDLTDEPTPIEIVTYKKDDGTEKSFACLFNYKLTEDYDDPEKVKQHLNQRGINILINLMAAVYLQYNNLGNEKKEIEALTPQDYDFQQKTNDDWIMGPKQ